MHDLLQLMYQDGFLSSTELVALRKTCRELKESPVRVLRSLNVASPAEVQGFLQRFYGCSAVTDALLDQLDESYKVLIPVDIALNYNIFAIAEEDSKLFVAVEDPTDVRLMALFEFFLERKIVACVATVHQLARGLSLLYGFDVNQLKLSTVLESSRGVVGGKMYEDTHVAQIPPEEKSELYLDDGFGEIASDPDLNFLSSPSSPGETLSTVADLNSGADSFSESFGSDLDVSPEASSLGLLKAIDPANEDDFAAQNETESAITDLDSFSPELGDESDDPSAGFDLEPTELETKSEELPSGELSVDELQEENSSSDEEFDFPSAADLVETPSAEESDGLLAPQEQEISTPEEISPSEEFSTSEEISKSEELVAPELGAEMLVKISAAANSALVRLAMVREKNAGLAKLNQSLEALHVVVSYDDGIFSVDANGTVEQWNSASDPQTPLAKVLSPALKKIASLA